MEKQISIALIALMVTACGSQALSGTTTSNENLTPDVKRPFSYSVQSYGNETAETMDGFFMNGHHERFVKGQALIRLTTTQALDAFLKKYDAKLVKQIYSKSFVKHTRYTDGSVRSEVEGPEKPLPMYLVAFNQLEATSLDGFKELADKLHVNGEMKFDSVEGAKLAKRILEIHNKNDRDILAAGFELSVEQHFCPVYPYSTNTTEGIAPGDVYPSVTYTGPDFWWTGPNHVYIGNNIIWASDSDQSLHELCYSSKSAGEGVKIAVIDNGYTLTNEGMSPTIFGAASVYYTNGNIDGVSPSGYHGRKISSLIFSEPDDGCGTIGTAHRATPLIYKVDLTNSSAVAYAVDNAVANGAKIINCSWGNYTDWPWNTLKYNFDAADAADVICVASTGNDGAIYGHSFPAGWSSVMGVSAHDKGGNIAAWTSGSTSYLANWHSADIYAGGIDIATAANPAGSAPYYNYTSYQPENGTSVAAPIVAGVCAVLVQRGKASDYSTALSRLTSTAYTYTAGTSLNAMNAAY